MGSRGQVDGQTENDFVVRAYREDTHGIRDDVMQNELHTTCNLENLEPFHSSWRYLNGIPCLMYLLSSVTSLSLTSSRCVEVASIVNLVVERWSCIG